MNKLKRFAHLVADEEVSTENAEEAELVDDVLLGGRDHLLVVDDDQTDPAAEEHRAEEHQADHRPCHHLCSRSVNRNRQKYQMSMNTPLTELLEALNIILVN